MTVRLLPPTPPDMRPPTRAKRRYSPPNDPMHRWMRSGELTAGGIYWLDPSGRTRFKAGGTNP
jgi:hypothetical protein